MIAPVAVLLFLAQTVLLVLLLLPLHVLQMQGFQGLATV